MERAVSALELEKNVLLFPDGAALDEGCNFRGETHHSGGAAAHDSRDMSDVAFRRQLCPAGCQRVLQRSDILIELLELKGFMISRALNRVCLEMIQSRRKRQPVGVEAFGDGLFHLQGRRKDFFPASVLLLEPGPDEIHLPLMFRLAEARRAATDVISLRGAGAQRDVNMWMSSVVVEAVSETDGIARMKLLGELPHDLLHRRVKNLVGIDAGGDKRIVLRDGHREHQPVSDDGPFGRGRKFSQVLEPRLGDSALSLIVGKLRRVRCSFRPD